MADDPARPGTPPAARDGAVDSIMEPRTPRGQG